MSLGEKWYPLAFRSGLLAFLLLVAYLARALLVSVLLAGALACLVRPVVAALERRGHPRTAAILLSFAAAGILGVAGFLSLLPDLTAQLTRLLGAIPVYAARVERAATYLETTYLRMVPAVLARYLDQRIFASEEALLAVVNQLLAGLLQLVKTALWLLMVPVIAFYFLRDGSRWKELALALLPAGGQADAAMLLGQMEGLLGAFVRGQLLVCLLVAFLSWGALAILGVDWAVLLGLFAGVAELIPYFGPVIGAAPAVLTALLSGPWPAVKVAVAFFLIQQLEGNVISPKLLGDRLGLHPLAVIVALVAGGRFGLAGLLLAVPVLAFCAVLIRFFAAHLARPA